MTCKHCGKPIRRYYGQYTEGWIHEDGNVWCLLRMAEPDAEHEVEA